MHRTGAASRLALFLLLLLDRGDAGPAFRYDVAPRVLAEVTRNLEPARLANGLAAEMHRTGAVSTRDEAGLRKTNFAITLAFEQMAMVYGGFESGLFLGHMRSTAAYDTFRFTKVNASADPSSNATAGLIMTPPYPPRVYWRIDNVTGNNIGPPVKSITTYQHLLRPWYVQAKQAVQGKGFRVSLWSKLYIFATEVVLGLSHLEPLVDPATGAFVGCLATDLGMHRIEAWLQATYKGSQQVVFITEGSTGNLVASSRAGEQPLLLKNTTTGKFQRIHSTNSVVPAIKAAARWLEARGWDYAKPYSLDIVDELAGTTPKHTRWFIEFTSFVEGNIDWKVIVLQPVACPPGAVLDLVTRECLQCRAGTTRPNADRSDTSSTTAPLVNKYPNATQVDDHMMHSLGGGCACQDSWGYQGDTFHGCTETSDWPGNNWCYVKDPSCILASAGVRGGTNRNLWRRCEIGDQDKMGSLADIYTYPCQTCAAGRFKDIVGGQPCFPCPADTYSDKIGALSDADCRSCPAGRTTSGVTGAVAVAACRCLRSISYRIEQRRTPSPHTNVNTLIDGDGGGDGDGNNDCAPCPTGADCSADDDLRLHQLRARPGFWRGSNVSTVFSDCREFHADHRRAVERCSVANGTKICKDSFDGPVCKQCAHGFLPRGPDCIPCEYEESPALTIGVLVGFACVPVVVLVMATLLRTRGVKREAQTFRVLGLLKVLIAFLQVVSSMAKTMRGVPWPASFVELTSWMGVINLDFFSVLPYADCRMALSAPSKFVVRMSLPILSMCSIYLGYWISVCVRRPLTSALAATRKLKVRHFCFLLMLLLYPSLSTSIFALFVCSSVPGVEGEWLSEDWRTRCFEGDHATIYAPLGVFAGIVYVLGTPTVLFWRLWTNRDVLHDLSSPRHDAIHFELGGLYKTFEKPYWYFEILVIVWKCFMTGALCVVAPNTAAQPMMATLFQLIFACLILKLSPFESDYDDIASFVSAASITLILLVASAIFANGKVAAEDKLYDDAALETMLLALTMGSLIAQVAIMGRVFFCPAQAAPRWCQRRGCRMMKDFDSEEKVRRRSQTWAVEKEGGGSTVVEMVAAVASTHNPMRGKAAAVADGGGR
jgi:hypothetical protein